MASDCLLPSCIGHLARCDHHGTHGVLSLLIDFAGIILSPALAVPHEPLTPYAAIAEIDPIQGYQTVGVSNICQRIKIVCILRYGRRGLWRQREGEGTRLNGCINTVHLCSPSGWCAVSTRLVPLKSQNSGTVPPRTLY